MSEEDYLEEEFSEDSEDSVKMFNGSIITPDYLTDNQFLIYKSEFEDGKSPIQYLEEGGEARGLLDAINRGGLFEFFYLLNQGVLMQYIPYAKGDFLDILGRNNTRNPPKNSYGDLLFKLPDDEIKNYPITIPNYTLVSTEDDEGLEFETIEEKTLVAGENSILVRGRSLYGGTEYNIGSNIITILDEDLDDLEVTNPTPFVGGTDAEDDEEYRVRLLNEQDGLNFGSVEWYHTMAEKIEGVHDVNIINCQEGDYTIGIIVNPPVEEVINRVTTFFTQDNNTPGGITAYISESNILAVDVVVNDCVFATGVNPDDVIEEIQTALLNYFNRLIIAQSVTRSDILTVLSKITNLIGYNLVNPMEDINSEDDSVFVAGTITIN
jgi:hypothetical protein